MEITKNYIRLLWVEFFLLPDSKEKYWKDWDLKTPDLVYVEHALVKMGPEGLDIVPLKELSPVEFYTSHILIDENPLLAHPGSEIFFKDLLSYDSLGERADIGGEGRKRWLITHEAARF